MSAIRDLLEQSRRAHQAYRDAVPRRVPFRQGTIAAPGDAVAAGKALWTACRLRVEAHALDPSLTDAAWKDEAVTHDSDALLTFYGEQLNR